MRAMIKSRVEAARKGREGNVKAEFSLTALIVAVAILGVLMAIALPVLAMIPQTA